MFLFDQECCIELRNLPSCSVKTVKYEKRLLLLPKLFLLYALNRQLCGLSYWERLEQSINIYGAMYIMNVESR